MVVCNVVGCRMRAIVVASESDTVLEFKERVKFYLHVEISRQRLFYDKQQVTLQNYESLRFYGIPNDPDPILYLFVDRLPGNPKFPVTIRWEIGAREETMNVREMNKVEDLKWKIGRRWGIMEDRKLILTHLHKEMLNEALLFDYYVHEGCIINVTIPPTSPR